MLQGIALSVLLHSPFSGGAASRHEIATGVIGGILFATLLGLLLIPIFYVSVRRVLGDELDVVTRAPG